MIKTPLVEWASAGDIAPAYSDAKKALGWLVGEPPLAPSWNEVEFTRDARINYLLRMTERLMTASPVASPVDVCSGLFYTPWEDPALSPNTIDFGETIRGACVGWSYPAQDHQLLVLTTAGDVYPVTGCGRYDIDPVQGDALALDYPTTPDVVYAICSDATHIYVVWGLTGGNFQVSRFSAETLAEVWTTDTGHLCSLSTTDEDVRIIASSATTVAVLLPPTFTTAWIAVLNKTTGAASLGVGNYTAGTGDYFDVQNAQIVSDGTHVFWIQYNPGTGDREYALLSALLTDPTTSSYTTPTVIVNVDDTAPWSRPKGLCRRGESIFISTAAGYLSFFSTTDEEHKAVHQVVLNQGPLHEAAQDVPLCYDGLNLWGLLTFADAGHAGRLTEVAFRIPAGGMTYRELVDGFDTITPPTVAINVEAAVEATYTSGVLLFDHYDIWRVRRDGNLYRITNPGAR